MVWKKGESGNPGGRPSKPMPSTQLRRQIAERVPEIIERLIQQALGGDAQAARLLIERCLPALRPIEQPQPITLPDGTLTEQGRAVLGAVAAGTLAPGQGAQLITAVGTLAKVAEIDELERRIAALEGGHESKS
jgi:hypothetical protein